METPPLRVSRPVSACARCRGAKIRCDGKLPACVYTACERAGKANECSSANDQFAKGKERSYVASLEARIERLHRQIAFARNQKGPLGASPSNDKTQYKHAPQKDATDVDELVSDFGYLSVNATASGYHGFTKEMSFARLVLSTSCTTKLPQPAGNVLPPRELAVRLIHDCLDRALTIYPVLTDSVVFGSMESVYQHKGLYCPAQDIWNFRLVLAIASLGQSRSKGDIHHQNGISHVSVALQHRESVLQPGSVSTVQALLLLVIYSILDPLHFNSWYLIGVAARVMVDVGLHQDLSTTAEARTRAGQIETRRRIFHCVYALDRAISMTHIRLFSFSDDSIEAGLPENPLTMLASQYHSFSSQTTVPPALEIVKFRQVQSAAFQALFGSARVALSAPWQSRAHLFRKVGDWISALPDSTPDALRHFLYCEMYYVDVLILSPPGYDSNLGPYGTALLLEYCVGFIRSARIVCDPTFSFCYTTILDLKRTELVSRIFLSLMNDHADILGVSELDTPPLSKGESLPPLQRSNPAEKVTQCINALAQLRDTLSVLGTKFGQPQSLSFKTDSSATLQRLYAEAQSYSLRLSSNDGYITQS